MKVNDKIQARKSMYVTFPVRDTIITEGELYEVLEIADNKFLIFDDNNHYREFWDVEFNELFINFTDDFNSLIRQLNVCVKLNKNIPIKIYDYILKQYKSFTLEYKHFEGRSVDKQVVGLTINNKTYDASLTAEQLLAQLKENYEINGNI